MAGAEPSDVIGVEVDERRSWPPLAGVAVGLAAGFGLGLLWSDSQAPGAPPGDAVSAPVAPPLSDGGLVEVCRGTARAYVFALGLPPGRTEVQLPLRGDGVLLPVLTSDAEVLTGVAEGHQWFLAQDGQLVIAQQLPVPEGPTIEAVVGEQRLTLAVRGCRGGSP